MPKNPPSKRICRRCGFEYEFHYRPDRPVQVCCESCRFVLPDEEIREYAAAVAA